MVSDLIDISEPAREQSAFEAAGDGNDQDQFFNFEDNKNWKGANQLHKSMY